MKLRDGDRVWLGKRDGVCVPGWYALRNGFVLDPHGWEVFPITTFFDPHFDSSGKETERWEHILEQLVGEGAL